jgi:hypothetical protein
MESRSQFLIASILDELPDRMEEGMRRGPIKKPQRAIEKIVRSYRRDAACLTDLVRSVNSVEGRG